MSFDPGAFQGSLKSKTVHLKAKYLSILRTQGSNSFWIEYVKKINESLLFFPFICKGVFSFETVRFFFFFPGHALF